MKRSVLSACAAIVQKEIEFYAGFTCLEYDVNDENTMRVAGTGIFRSIIYANENQPYSAIEQAKTDRKPVFVRNRNSSICRKCSTNRICTGRQRWWCPCISGRPFWELCPCCAMMRRYTRICWNIQNIIKTWRFMWDRSSPGLRSHTFLKMPCM